MFDKFKKLFQGKNDQPQQQKLTPEEDIAIARDALGKGEFEHAAFHVGCALVSNPNRPDWLSVLNQIITIAPDPLALAPKDEKMYAGTAAVRAYILAHLGQYDEAVKTIIQVSRHLPESGYIQWAIAWIGLPEAQGKVNVDSISSLLAKYADPAQQAQATDAAQRATISKIPILISECCRNQNPSGAGVFQMVVYLKRIGDMKLAEAIARRAYERQPDYYSANCMASMARANGDLDAAIEYYRKCCEFNPADVAVKLDLGDLLADRGDFAESADAYSGALAIEPNHTWALPSYFAVMYQHTQDTSWRDKFDAYAKANPSNQRASQLKQTVYGAFIGGVLPEPSEATINVIKQMLEKNFTPSEKEGKVSIGLSALEAPSAILAVNTALKRIMGPNVSLAVDVKMDGSPDPRQPRIPVQPLLWSYSGVTATPALSPPPDDVARVVADLAATNYSSAGWWRAAVSPARQVGQSHGYQLIAAMLHPSPTPSSMSTWDWLQRTQYAAAFLIGRLDDGWANSTRRSLLLALVNGQMDWPVGAAAVVLSMIASDVPAAEAEVTDVLTQVVMHGMKLPGYCPFLEPTVIAGLNLPNLPKEIRKELIEIIKQIHAS